MEQYLAHRKFYVCICYYYVSIKVQLSIENSACKGEILPALHSLQNKRLPTLKLSKGNTAVVLNENL